MGYKSEIEEEIEVHLTCKECGLEVKRCPRCKKEYKKGTKIECDLNHPCAKCYKEICDEINKNCDDK